MSGGLVGRGWMLLRESPTSADRLLFKKYISEIAHNNACASVPRHFQAPIDQKHSVYSYSYYCSWLDKNSK